MSDEQPKPPLGDDCRLNHADPGYCLTHESQWPQGRYRCNAVDEFRLGDKVRVRSASLDRKAAVYTVDVITPTQVRASNEHATLCLGKEKWQHA